MANFMLTTEDNPFDPTKDFDSWYAWDESMGYRTCGLIARLAMSSTELSQEEQDIEEDRAIDLIIEMNPTGNYKKIKINN